MNETLSKMYKTTTKCISQGHHPQTMPTVRLCVFITRQTIVSLGTTSDSQFPGIGLPIEVKRTVRKVMVL